MSMLGWMRSLKVQLGLAACVVLLYPALVAFRAYRDERRCFIPVRHKPRLSVADFAIPGLADVSFSTPAGTTLRGVFAPPRNGAAVILTHGSLGEHSDLMPEARLLSGAGFGVLAFDWPGHGESDGGIEWGAGERSALSSAIAWLSAQPGVDAARIGVFGFSMGGHTVTQVAAQDTRLRAVAIAGTPPDPLVHLHWEYRHLGALRRLPARLALVVSGMKTDEQVPEQVIGQIAPRPVLLVAGKDDELVPTWMTERLFAAANEPKTLMVVPRAGHGGYSEASPEYSQGLLRFFEVLTR